MPATPLLSRLRLISAAIVALVLGVSGALLGVTAASAAQLDGVITSITVDKTDYNYRDRVRADFTWTAPASANAGDTFTIDLPDALTAASTNPFTLLSPDGLTVATASWNGKTVVFTLTDYVDTHSDVTGTGFLALSFDHAVVTPEGGPHVLDFGVSSVTVNVRPLIAPGPTPTSRTLTKFGYWRTPAQDATSPTAALQFVIQLPGGPNLLQGPLTVTDAAKPGISIDCPSVALLAATVPNGGPFTTVDPARYDVTQCAAGALVVVLDRIDIGEYIRVTYTASVTDPSLDEYGNNVVLSGPGGLLARFESRVERIDAGGDGSGVQRVSVGDFVWVDINANGVQDAGEPGIPDVQLSLTGPGGSPVTAVNGTPVTPVLTDANGLYSFSDLPVLPAGQHYTVTLDQAASAAALGGLVPTQAGVGDSATDSSTGSAESTDLTTDLASDLTLDFGFIGFQLPTEALPGGTAGAAAGAPELAATGPVTTGLLPFAGMLTLAGIALVLASRRRRSRLGV